MKRKQTNLFKSLPHPHHHHHQHVICGAKCGIAGGRRPTMLMLIQLSLLWMALIYRLSAVYAAAGVSSTTVSRDAATTADQIKGRGNFRRNRRLTDVDDDDNDDDDNDDDVERVGSITGLLLMNSNLDIPIRKVINETQYNLYNYPTLNLNMKIKTNGNVGSVVMVHSHSNSNGASTYTRIDSATPFSLCGDTNTTVVVPTTPSSIINITMNAIDYDKCSLLSMEGNHVITVTPYISPGATGRSGQPYITAFRVLNTNAEERKCKVPKVCHT
jgi:hypothetical protein